MIYKRISKRNYLIESKNHYLYDKYKNEIYYLPVQIKGLLLAKFCQTIENSEPMIEFKYNNHILSIEFMITKNCNMECPYCIQHSNINNSSRMLNNNHIDDFFEQLENIPHGLISENLGVSFSGGEPLLNYDMIKYIVSKFNDSKFKNTYYLVTNGILLDKVKMDYFNRNNFKITVSLDGIAIESADRTLINNNQNFTSVDSLLKNKSNIA